MKKTYFAPEIETVDFESQQIIAASLDLIDIEVNGEDALVGDDRFEF